MNDLLIIFFMSFYNILQFNLFIYYKFLYSLLIYHSFVYIVYINTYDKIRIINIICEFKTFDLHFVFIIQNMINNNFITHILKNN